jgi:hypothetical protein
VIGSLEDAWAWYTSVKSLADDMARLGRKFWDREDWAEGLGQDNHFRSVESSGIMQRSKTVLDELDDLAVLVLFSVFEMIVRDQARKDVELSLPKRLHPAVDRAVKDLIEEIEAGSFGKLTHALKSIDHDLIEQVNQVRRYRNWVAHGRSGDPPDLVRPRMAFERLSLFLARMTEAARIVGPEGT